MESSSITSLPGKDELIDMIAGLDVISSHLHDCSDFRHRAAAVICMLAHCLPQDDKLYTIYKTFILDRYRCFKHSDFVAEIASADMNKKQDVVSICKLVRGCNLLDLWEKFTSALNDLEMATDLFAEKCQE